MRKGRKIDRTDGGPGVIVALETSGRLGSVALGEGGRLVAERSFTAPMRHSAELFGAISVVLEGAALGPSDISEVYISVGPGSFTGLRIAASFAKAMALANGARIVGVGTLDVIAANVGDYEEDSRTEFGRVGTILDAKRGQFYVALYEKKERGLVKVLEDSVMTAARYLEAIKPEEGRVWLLGEGLVYYRDKFACEGVDFLPRQYWYPRASKVHLLGWAKARRGEYEEAMSFSPRYLMRPDVRVKGG
jgi:tRNA threonylcarbamoyladenosine biosynthesis protein TsaB